MKVQEILKLNYEDMDVYQVISAISSRMGWVGKDGSVAFKGTKYAYPTEAAFLAAVKPLADEYGLVVYPIDMEFIPTDKSSVTAVKVRYNFVASKYTGDRERSTVVVSLGEGADNLDKGGFKALTGAYKYALRQSFMIGTGDDPEATDETGKKTSSSLYDFFVSKIEAVGHSINDPEVIESMKSHGLTVEILNEESTEAIELAKAVVKDLKG